MPRARRVRARARGPTPRLLWLLYCFEVVRSRSSSWRITPVKREPEKLRPLAVKIEANADPPHRGVIGPEDYLLPGQEDHLVRAIMECWVREA
ncbi:hypothetical protein D1007_48009 [Hordeum vulgare]|nr:hypothetical protein D1007_48009 [Hordeum vulgare]